MKNDAAGPFQVTLPFKATLKARAWDCLSRCDKPVRRLCDKSLL